MPNFYIYKYILRLLISLNLFLLNLLFKVNCLSFVENKITKKKKNECCSFIFYQKLFCSFTFFHCWSICWEIFTSTTIITVTITITICNGMMIVITNMNIIIIIIGCIIIVIGTVTVAVATRWRYLMMMMVMMIITNKWLAIG